MQIGISMGTPGAAHSRMPTLRLGRGALAAHKEKRTAAGSSPGQSPPPSPHQLLATNAPCYYGGGGGGGWGHKEKEREETER